MRLTAFMFVYFLKHFLIKAEVEIFMKRPILFGKDSMTVYCEPQEDSKKVIDSIEMIRVYVEHDGGKLGTTASKLSRIVKSTEFGSAEIQMGPAKTGRYNITGNISMVEKAYLGVYVKSEDVLCSDSRLFRCEMSFTLKNGTEATVYKDGSTCVQGPCNECNFGIQNLEISSTMANEDKMMINYLLPVGGVLALFGTVSLVVGIVLTIKSVSRRRKEKGTDPKIPTSIVDAPGHYAEPDDFNRLSRGYMTTMQKTKDENVYSILK